MKVGFVSPSRVVVMITVMVLVLVLWLLSTSSASGQYPVPVIPKVNVETGGSLSIAGGTVNGNQIDFGNMGPGQVLEKTLSLSMTANSAWHLTVSKNQDLTDSLINATIPSNSLTFMSNGNAAATYVASGTQFGSSDTSVVTNGSATGGSNVNVVYKLVMPADQRSSNPGVDYYSAVHTYTLVVGSP